MHAQLNIQEFVASLLIQDDLFVHAITQKYLNQYTFDLLLNVLQLY